MQIIPTAPGYRNVVKNNIVRAICNQYTTATFHIDAAMHPDIANDYIFDLIKGNGFAIQSNSRARCSLARNGNISHYIYPAVQFNHAANIKYYCPACFAYCVPERTRPTIFEINNVINLLAPATGCCCTITLSTFECRQLCYSPERKKHTNKHH